MFLHRFDCFVIFEKWQSNPSLLLEEMMPIIQGEVEAGNAGTLPAFFVLTGHIKKWV